MRFIRRWFRRRHELAQIAPRRASLEAQLSQALTHAVSLVPAATKGGYDEIFYVMHENRRQAVVRLNSPFKRNDDPVGEHDAGLPLGPTQRIDREWTAYERLSPHGLSPRPLWRCGDAIACEWLVWDRVVSLLKKSEMSFWPLMDRMIPAISRMHDLGVTHLDLNPGNLLCEPGGAGIAFIDFEFGPREWVTLPQQMGYDYLRLIDSCTKRRRGGSQMLGDIGRLIRLLDAHAHTSTREADLAFTLEKLTPLAQQPRLLEQLRTIFRKL